MKYFKLPQIIIRTVTAVQRWLRPSDLPRTKDEDSNQGIRIGHKTSSLIGILPKDASIEDYKEYLDEKYG